MIRKKLKIIAYFLTFVMILLNFSMVANAATMSQVERIQVDVNHSAVVGQNLDVNVYAHYKSGITLNTKSGITLKSSNNKIAEINKNKHLVTKKNGEVQITAYYEKHKSSQNVKISNPPVYKEEKSYDLGFTWERQSDFIKLSWNSLSIIKNVCVYRKDNQTNSYTALDDKIVANSFVDNNLNLETAYTYKIDYTIDGRENFTIEDIVIAGFELRKQEVPKKIVVPQTNTNILKNDFEKYLEILKLLESTNSSNISDEKNLNLATINELIEQYSLNDPNYTELTNNKLAEVKLKQNFVIKDDLIKLSEGNISVIVKDNVSSIDNLVIYRLNENNQPMYQVTVKACNEKSKQIDFVVSDAGVYAVFDKTSITDQISEQQNVETLSGDGQESFQNQTQGVDSQPTTSEKNLTVNTEKAKNDVSSKNTATNTQSNSQNLIDNGNQNQKNVNMDNQNESTLESDAESMANETIQSKNTTDTVSTNTSSTNNTSSSTSTSQVNNINNNITENSTTGDNLEKQISDSQVNGNTNVTSTDTQEINKNDSPSESVSTLDTNTQSVTNSNSSTNSNNTNNTSSDTSDSNNVQSDNSKNTNEQSSTANTNNSKNTSTNNTDDSKADIQTNAALTDKETVKAEIKNTNSLYQVDEKSEKEVYDELVVALDGLLNNVNVTVEKDSQAQFNSKLPNGQGIWVVNGDRESILSLINSSASKTYYIDENGFLKEDTSIKEDNSKSQTFAMIIDELIKSNKKTILGQSSEWQEYVAENDSTNIVDWNNMKMGVTLGKNGTDQIVILSEGQPAQGSENDNSNIPLLSLILLHEMSHALRGSKGRKGSNEEEEIFAISVENIVRDELGLLPRQIQDYNEAYAERENVLNYGSQNLRKGDDNSYVAKLQEDLMYLGFDLGVSTPTGYFGDNTYYAVVTIQQYNGLSADGVVGNATYKAIRSYVNSATYVYKGLNVYPERADLLDLYNSLRNSTTAILQLGSSGSDVTNLQLKLKLLEFDLGGYTATGYYGIYTEMSVKAIQMYRWGSSSAKVDGICGPETMIAINYYVNIKKGKDNDISAAYYCSNIEPAIKAYYNQLCKQRTIEYGESGTDVEEIQKNLVLLGFDLGNGGVVTGYYGDYTKASIQAIQKYYSYNATGNCTKDVRDRIKYLVSIRYTQEYIADEWPAIERLYSLCLDGIELDPGDSGIAVRNLQLKLERMGFDLGGFGASGYFGEYTKIALRAIQLVNGLSDVGRYGPATRELVNSYYNNLVMYSNMGSYANLWTTKLKPKYLYLVDNEMYPLYGEEGTAVTRLQEKLMEIGFDLGGYGATGYFGEYTKAAMFAIQEVMLGLTGSSLVARYGPGSHTAVNDLLTLKSSNSQKFYNKKALLMTAYTRYVGDFAAVDKTINLQGEFTGKMYYYDQEDAKWGNTLYPSPSDADDTIAIAGCGPTSMAMVVSSFGRSIITPVEACNIARTYGYRHDNGTYPGLFLKMADMYDINVESYSKGRLDVVKEKLATGNYLAIAIMGQGVFTSGGHYIVLSGISTIDDYNYFTVYDSHRDNPNYTKASDYLKDYSDYDGILKARTSIFAAQVASGYWLFSINGSSAGESELDSELRGAGISLERVIAVKKNLEYYMKNKNDVLSNGYYFNGDVIDLRVGGVYYNGKLDSNYEKAVANFIKCDNLTQSYNALNNKVHKFLFLEHWLKVERADGSIEENPAPSEWFSWISEIPTTTGGDEITSENKECYETYEYFHKWLKPVYMVQAHPSEYEELLYKQWLINAYGKSKSEIDGNFLEGFIEGITFDTINGMVMGIIEGAVGAYKLITNPEKLAEAAAFIAKVTSPIGFTAEKELFAIMVVEAVKGYIESSISEYKNATSRNKGRMIGQMVGTVALVLIDGIGTVKAASSFVKVLRSADNLKDVFKSTIGKKAETIVNLMQDTATALKKLKSYLTSDKIEGLFEVVRETEDLGDSISYTIDCNGAMIDVKINKSELTENQKEVSLIGCFTGDTEVLTKDGLKRIDAVKTGDYVLAKDIKSGLVEYKEVLYTYIKSCKEFVHIRFDGEEIKTTRGHLFFVDNWWKAAENIQIGDRILDANGEYKIVTEVEFIELEENEKIYNLNVEDFHTYFVGNKGLLVHNSCDEKMTAVMRSLLEADKIAGEGLKLSGDALKNWIDNIWNSYDATKRGQIIESYLSETDYKNWGFMGREKGGYWEGFDFADDFSGTISSLKTLDPRLSSYTADGCYSAITKYIDDLYSLGKVTLANDKIVAKKLLDVRVPVGTRSMANIARIEEYASKYGIQVIIKEY